MTSPTNAISSASPRYQATHSKSVPGSVDSSGAIASDVLWENEGSFVTPIREIVLDLEGSSGGESERDEEDRPPTSSLEMKETRDWRENVSARAEGVGDTSSTIFYTTRVMAVSPFTATPSRDASLSIRDASRVTPAGDEPVDRMPSLPETAQQNTFIDNSTKTNNNNNNTTANSTASDLITPRNIFPRNRFPSWREGSQDSKNTASSLFFDTGDRCSPAKLHLNGSQLISVLPPRKALRYGWREPSVLRESDTTPRSRSAANQMARSGCYALSGSEQKRSDSTLSAPARSSSVNFTANAQRGLCEASASPAKNVFDKVWSSTVGKSAVEAGSVVTAPLVAQQVLHSSGLCLAADEGREVRGSRSCCVASIEIQPGVVREVRIQAGDDVAQVAQQFLSSHGLPSDVFPLVRQYLEEEMGVFTRRMDTSGTTKDGCKITPSADTTLQGSGAGACSNAVKRPHQEEEALSAPDRNTRSSSAGPVPPRHPVKHIPVRQTRTSSLRQSSCKAKEREKSKDEEPRLWCATETRRRAIRSSSPPSRSARKRSPVLTSTEREIAEHCTFTPKINKYFGDACETFIEKTTETISRILPSSAPRRHLRRASYRGGRKSASPPSATLSKTRYTIRDLPEKVYSPRGKDVHGRGKAAAPPSALGGRSVHREEEADEYVVHRHTAEGGPSVPCRPTFLVAQQEMDSTLYRGVRACAPTPPSHWKASTSLLGRESVPYDPFQGR